MNYHLMPFVFYFCFLGTLPVRAEIAQPELSAAYSEAGKILSGGSAAAALPASVVGIPLTSPSNDHLTCDLTYLLVDNNWAYPSIDKIRVPITQVPRLPEGDEPIALGESAKIGFDNEEVFINIELSGEDNHVALTLGGKGGPASMVSASRGGLCGGELWVSFHPNTDYQGKAIRTVFLHCRRHASDNYWSSCGS